MAHSANGKLVPVVPGGHNVPLTFSNRTEYVERALDYRLHEMDRQVGFVFIIIVVIIIIYLNTLCCCGRLPGSVSKGGHVLHHTRPTALPADGAAAGAARMRLPRGLRGDATEGGTVP